MLVKPLRCAPWFPSSPSCPAPIVRYHRMELMCSVLLNSQGNVLNRKLCEQLMAELINPAFQLSQCLRCKHNPTVPLSLLWQRMLRISSTITSKPYPAPWRSFSLKHAPAFLQAVSVSVPPPTWPIFKSQTKVSCFSRPFVFSKVIVAQA